MVRRSASHHLAFDAAAIYQYPEHLRQWLEGLPDQPGVYIFYGESENLPLYIGKSINLRSRVMAHFRAPDEASMLRQARRLRADARDVLAVAGADGSGGNRKPDDANSCY